MPKDKIKAENVSNLNEIIQFINEMNLADEKELLALTIEDALASTHTGFLMYIRNTFKLWKGGKLAKWFNKQGINHADDMSEIILTSYYRTKNNQKINLKEQIIKIREYWIKVDPTML